MPTPIPPDATPDELVAIAAPMIGTQSPQWIKRGVELLELAAQGYEKQNKIRKVVQCRILAAKGYLLLKNTAQVNRLLDRLSLILAEGERKDEVTEIIRQCNPSVWERLVDDE